MATLQSILDEFTDMLRNDVDGLSFVPDDPPSVLGNGPGAIVYHQSGRARIGPAQLAAYYADISIAIVTNNNDAQIAHQVIMPYLEPVIEGVFNKLKANTNNFTIENLGESVNWTFGGVSWGGIEYLGYIITFSDVKYQRTLN